MLRVARRLLPLALTGLLAVAWSAAAAAQAQTPTHAAKPRAAAQGEEAKGPDRRFKVFMVLHRAGALADVGFKDYLESSNLDIEFVVRNIAGDGSKLPAIVEEIRAAKPDLIYAQATIVAEGILGEYDDPDPSRFVRDIPVVFSMVSTPVRSKLVTPPKKRDDEGPLISGSNVTGVVHVVSEEVQLNAMFAFMDIKKLGMVADLSEQTQRDRVARFKAFAEKRGIELVVESPLDQSGKPQETLIEPMIARIAEAKPDLLYIPQVNFFGRHSDLLTQTAVKYKLPTFCAIEVQIRSHGLTGLVAPFYNVGQLAGYKAEQILRGQKKAGEVPIETLSRFSFIVNMRTARELNFYPPMKILRYAQIIND